MTKSVSVLFLVLGLMLVACGGSSSGNNIGASTPWLSPYGESSINTSTVTGRGSPISITLDNAGNPLVTWGEQKDDGSTEVFARQWDGTKWVALGQTLVGGVILRGKIEANTDASNAPVVGIPVSRSLPAGESYLVMRWNGSSWVDLQPNCESGRLVKTPQGVLVVLCIRSNNTTLKRWNGSAWEVFGNPLSFVTSSQSVAAFTLAPSGESVVVTYNNNGFSLVVYKLLPTGWEQTGGNLRDTNNSNFFVFDVTAAVDSLGRIYVSWNEGLAGIVKRWDGTAWTQLGQSINVTTNFSANIRQILFDDSNSPMLVFSEGNEGVIISRWNQNGWSKLASGYVTTTVKNPGVYTAARASDGTIIFAVYSQNPRLFVRAFRPTQ